MTALSAKFHTVLPEGDLHYDSSLFRAKMTLRSLLPLLYGSGMSKEGKHKLECFFEVHDFDTKAYTLQSELEALGYEAEVLANSNGGYRVEAKTTPILMSEESMQEWVEWMCRIAYCINCSFRGWRSPDFGC